MAKAVITADFTVRRSFRRWLDREGLAYTEDAGWLNSQFVIPEVSERQARVIRRNVEVWRYSDG
ncbi:hypothetical protein [Paracoccus sp. SY]|uniref:hypothetical protein n=1 Tax=Paracoccus sp. SY TaxID=1330255 RepID=UPI000CD2B08A|nr:hypothetical protein [Paracoccus sp. SY]